MNRTQKIDVRWLLLSLLMAPALAFAQDAQISSFTDSPDPVVTGATYSYEIVVRNNAPQSATNTRLNVTVLAGADFVSAGPPAANCTPTSATQIDCNLGTVLGGNVDVRTITMTWRATAVGLINATATLTSDVDVNPDNNVQNQQTTVNPGSASDADLQITSKSIISPLPIAVGSSVTFRIAPRNSGAAVATGVTVTDVLPAGWTYVSAAGPNWACSASAQTVTCSRASMPVGATDDIDLVATAPATVPIGGSSFTNTASIAGTTNDPAPGNNSASVSGTVLASGADLRLSKSKLPLTVAAGTTTSLTSTLTVINNGPAAATGALRVVEVLSNETYVGSSGTGWSCTSSAGVVTCDHPNAGGLAATASLPVLTINTLATGTGSATNTACTGNSVPSGAGGATPSPPIEGDPNPTNDCATASSTTALVGGTADLEVVSVVTTTPTGGDKNVSVTENSVTFTSVIRNNGTAGATGVVIVHNEPELGLQPGVTLAATVSAGSSATFTCSTELRNCVQSGGALLAGETVTTVFTASRPLPTYGNPGTTRTFTTTVSNTAETDTNPANNSKSDVYTIDSVTDLEIVSKTVSPATVYAGQTATYVITVRNKGPDPAANFDIKDTFTFPSPTDPGFEVVSLGYADPNAGVCAPATEITPAANTLTCTVWYLAGTPQQIILVVRPRGAPGSPSRLIANTAQLDLVTVTDSNPANNSKTAQLTVQSNAIDLLVNKIDSFDPVQYVPGATFIDYRVTVTNNGPSAGTNVRITETTVPPTGKRIRFVCDTTGFGSATCNATPLCSPTNIVSAAGTALPPVTCSVPADDGTTSGPTLGTLANGLSKNIYLRYEVLDRPDISGDVFTSAAAVTSDQNETFVANNSITELSTARYFTSSVSGTVFEDRVRDGANAGTPQAGEPRLAGVSLRLTGTDSLGAAVDRTTTSDAGGNFILSNLPPSNGAGYVLTQTQPSGYVNGPADPPVPSAGGSYSRGGAAGDSSYSAIVLGASVDAANYNFPEVRQVSLSGFVYIDVNANSVRDAGTDGPIPGATVRLLNAGTLALVGTATTDANGAYSFVNLDPLTVYTLEQPLPVTAGTLTNGPVNPGLIGGAACASGCTAQPNTPSAGTDRIATIDLSAGLDGTLFNFGEIQITAISGTVYVDRNRNGVLDPIPTDSRLAGVTLALHVGSTCVGVPQSTTTTDAQGSYTFGALVPGQTYTVCETQPAGYGDGSVNPSPAATSPAANTLTIANMPAQGSAGNSFGELIGSVAGTVYLDANNDGVRQGGEAGIAGVQVTLSGTDARGAAVNRTATTDVAGNFLFDDVVGSGAGGYALTQQAAQPVVGGVTTLNGRTTAGTVGGVTAGTASAPGVAPSTISAIALGGGAQSAGNAFGEILPVTISGVVFSDANNNGQQNLPADAGLSGVSIALTGTDDLGGAVNRALTTLLDGTFSVADLRPGTYTLTEPNQPPGTSNGLTVAGTAGGTATGVATLPSAISGIVLTTPGATSVDNRFAEIPDIGVISGRVWLDANNDGVVDGTEAGIAGQTIQLTGTDTLGNPVSRSTTTGADGSYGFTALSQGTYTVTQPSQPPGTFNGRTIAGTAGGTATGQATLPSAISAIVLGIGQSSLNNNFAELGGGTISGRVWFDANNDGVVGVGEVGIANQTIQLTGTDGSGGAVSRSTSTAADGTYAFSDLAPGTYTVTQPAQPAGTFNGQTIAGTGGGTATAVGTTPSAISGIVLAAGQVTANNLFGETAIGQISGRVWLDVNNNGVVDGAEAGIGGVTLALSGTDTLGNAVSVSALTGADGSFSFQNLRPGTYAVTEPTQPAGTLNGTTVAGSGGGTATPVATTPSAISGIVLGGTATASTNNNFGELPGAQIAGRVWIDTDNNGVIGASELGISGIVLSLSGTNDLGAAVSASTTTAGDGSYSFTGLRAGTYTVTQPTQPAGTFNGITSAGTAGGTATAVTTTPSAVSGIVLGAAQVSSGNNFGELPGAQVTGRVWLDLNNNGVVDGSESGIASVSIALTGTDDLGASVSRTGTTGTDGSYSFVGLRPGTYTVTEPAQPAGTLNGRTLAGTRGGTATGVGTVPSAISGIVLAAGQASNANNFGEIAGGQLAGRVWADANNDGQVGASEVGLSGVTIALTGTDDLGSAVNVSRTTGVDGSFSFGDLRPGSYVLTEPTQPAGTSNGVTLAGTAGGAPTPVSTTPSKISDITLAAGVAGTGYLFGEIPDSADVFVSKSHTKAAFTVGLTGSYQIRVRNGGSVPTSGAYTVQDRLPAGLTLASTPSGAGWTCVGAAGASSFSCSSDAVIAGGQTRAEAITVVVNVGAQAAAASPVSNAVLVEGGGEVPARGPSVVERNAFQSNPSALPVCTAAITHNTCRDDVVVQQSAAVSGTVWTDGGSALRVLDSGDTRLGGWQVEVIDLSSNAIVGRATTAANGGYRVSGLEPGVNLAIRFREATSGVVFGYPVNGETAPGSSGATCVDGTPPAGTTSSCVQTGATPQLVVFLAPGAELPQQSLPVDPGGVVYDSVLRTPVTGSVVTLAPTGSCPGWDPSTSVVAATLGGYTVSGSSISMNVGAQGQYAFLLTPTAPASCTFGLAVTPPAGYAFPSATIVPSAGPFTPTGGTGAVVAVQPQPAPPTAEPGPATTYYLALTIGSGTAGVVHNHIPVDPSAIGTLTLTKVGDRAVAEVGDSVRYTLTVTQAASGGRPLQTTLVDRLPAGFTYIAGTASVNGVPVADPAGGVGPVLAFNLGVMPAEHQLVLRYRVRVGVGSQQGDGINRAQGHACNVAAGCVDASRNPLPNAVSTNAAQFRVRVLGGVFTTDACVLGKIFVDCNNNHVQDPEELGIPGVRLVLSDGTLLISDSEGKYSLCGLPPRSHVMRADPSTLPRGSRLTTSSNRNLGDAGSLWLDLKNGELHRADFIEGSCSNTVLEQVKARRAQGEVRSVETEKKRGPALRFDSKAHGLDTLRSPQQGTDGANQQAPKPRATSPVPPSPASDETNVPTIDLPMNQPPPQGRTPGDPPDGPKTGGASANGGSHGTR